MHHQKKLKLNVSSKKVNLSLNMPSVFNVLIFSPTVSIDDDISQLIPPTFSTISTGPPQPMLDLDWNHKYNPFGEKIPNANIHMCVTCRLPIRIYGRLVSIIHVDEGYNLKGLNLLDFLNFHDQDTLQTCLLLWLCQERR